MNPRLDDDRRALRAALTMALCTALAACGGGGPDAGAPLFPQPAPAPSPAPAPAPAPAPGTSNFGAEGPSASFAQQCAADNQLADAPRRTATLAREKQWLRAYFDEAYLWPQDIGAIDPARYTPAAPTRRWTPTSMR